jgi:hypothetical protein
MLAATALAVGMVATAMATPPNVTLGPPQDADGVPDGGSASPSFEVVFSAGVVEITVTPSGGSGTGLGDITSLICLMESGDPEISKSPGSISFEGGVNTTPQSIALECASSAASKLAVLKCNEKKGGVNTATYRWDVSCPVAGAPQEYTSSPPGAATLSVATTQGADASANLTVTNTGGSPLSITSVAGLSPPVSVTPGSAMIGAGDAQVFTIGCSGTASGTFSQNFTVNSNDADEGAVAYGVDCVVTSAEYSATAASGASLPPITGAQGGPAPTTTVMVTNAGDAALTLGAIGGLSAPISASFGSTMLAPAASTALTVSCDATGAGAFGPQTLTFATNDPDDGEGTISYGVSCNILPPTSGEFSAAPAPPGPINLANTADAPAVTASVTIDNTGDANLVLGAPSPALTSPLSVGFSPPGPVPPFGSTTMTVSCAGPVATSSNQALNFSTNDPDDGEGVISYSLSCAINAAPAPEFAATPPAPGPLAISTTQGTDASAQLTVQNVGSASMALSVATPPAPPVSLSAVPATVAVGASTVITATCNAASPGTFNRSFTLSTGDSDEASVAFNVICDVAAPPPQEVTPTPAPRGPVGITTFQGVNGQVGVTLRNEGSALLQVLSVTGLAPPFSASATPFTVPPEDKNEVVISCDASALGFFTDSFTIATDDPDEPTLDYDVTCRVQSNSPEFDSFPSPGSLSFIETYSGESGALFLFVSNLGGRPLNLSASLLAPLLPPTPLSVSPAAMTIQPGFGSVFTVVCQPSAEGNYGATVRLAHDDTGESPAGFDINCFARPDTRAAFRVLLHGGVFTAGKTEMLLKNGFE